MGTPEKCLHFVYLNCRAINHTNLICYICIYIKNHRFQTNNCFVLFMYTLHFTCMHKTSDITSINFL